MTGDLVDDLDDEIETDDIEQCKYAVCIAGFDNEDTEIFFKIVRLYDDDDSAITAAWQINQLPTETYGATKFKVSVEEYIGDFEHQELLGTIFSTDLII